MNLDESARTCGGHQWVEQRLFEILGGWVAATPEVEVRLMLDRHSLHHAWRAQQWRDRLPVLADVDRDALCTPPTAAWDAAFGAMGRLEPTGHRLAAAYRVVIPRLHSRYHDHRAVANGIADGATQRTLDIVAPDVAGDWQEGERILQRLGPGAGAMAAAAVIEAEFGPK